MQILVTKKPVCTSACPFVRGPFADGEYRCSICPSHTCKSPIVCPYLKEHEAYTYRELMEHAKAYLTEDVFTKSCSCCQWYKAGICKYEDFWSKQ